MKNLIVEMLKNKQLVGKKLEIILVSGKLYQFDLTTDKMDLCIGHDYLMFDQNQRQYAINCKQVETFIIS